MPNRHLFFVIKTPIVHIYIVQYLKVIILGWEVEMWRNMMYIEILLRGRKGTFT